MTWHAGCSSRGMGSAEWKNLWMYMSDLQERVARPEVVPHEESELHRVFCDEHFCVESGPREE